MILLIIGSGLLFLDHSVQRGGAQFSYVTASTVVMRSVLCLWRHAGVLIGISNTVATIPGILAPTIAGLLTP